MKLLQALIERFRGDDPLPANDRDDVLPPTLGQVAWRIVKRGSLAALVLSVVIHAVFLALSFMIGFGFGGGSGGDPERGGGGPVEMAVISESDLAQLEQTALGMQTPTVPEAELKQVDLPVMEVAPGGTSTGSLEAPSDIAPVSGGGDITGSGGEGLGGTGGGGGASFFGVEAKGNRFAYVVDISGSMEGPRIEALRRELSTSINRLLETSSVYIVTFASEAKVLGTGKGWVETSSSGRKRVLTEVAGIQPSGGTIPYPAFELLFELRPRPDAIYFMTDGEFGDEMADQIIALNARTRIPIHCICLGSKEGENVMKKIAKLSRGTYTFVQGP